MSDQSYSEYSSTGHESPGDVQNISFASLRSYGSQISIDTQTSIPPSPAPTTSCSQEFQSFQLTDLRLLKRKSRVFGGTKRKGIAKARAFKKVVLSKKVSQALPIRVPEPEVISLSESLPAAEFDAPSHSNILLNLNTLRGVLDSMAHCSRCGEGKLQLLPIEVFSGSATYFVLKCSNCDSKRKFWSVSGRFHSKLNLQHESIPKRNDTVYASVLAGRLIGVGWQRLSLYHSFLNIPGPMASKTFSIAQANLLIAAEEVARESMDLARDEMRLFLNTDPSTQYVSTVGSYDGAYQQRSGKSGGGFSRYCFAAAVIADTGKVVAYDVACNSCNICSMLANKLQRTQISKEDHESRIEEHRKVCPAEYSDLASVHLESALAPKVITEALERGVRFTAIVSDGDNKTHDILMKSGIYNHLEGSPTIERYECLAHVAKRMKTNLHKKQEKILKLVRSDKEFLLRDLAKKGASKKDITKKLAPQFRGKIQRTSLLRDTWDSTKGKELRTLSLAYCGQIASYYRLAVQRHPGDVPAIINAINAIPLHLSATDENAGLNHRLCPYSAESWCRYQAAKYTNLPLPSHPNHLGKEATNLIQELFTDFGYNSPEFVEKISGGRTSNHNKSIHSLLFTMVHKTDAIGIDVMKIGSALAVIRYNEGFKGIKRLLKKLGIDISPRLEQTLRSFDSVRAKHNTRILMAQKQRFHKKQQRGKTQSKQISKHGPGYSSGKFTVAKSTIDSEYSSEEEVATKTALSVPTPTSSKPDECCHICRGTDDNRLVGIGLGMEYVEEEIEWVACGKCYQWYHQLCLEEPDTDVFLGDWYCDICI